MSTFADWPDHVWSWLVHSNPDAWAAAAGWTTVGVALIAGKAAFRQVREAKALREEQSQPYVVAYIEPSQASQHIIDLVVKNFGVTGAHNVTMNCDPPLRRTTSDGTGSEEVRIFETIPFLAPGQEWRVFWDSGISRKDSDLPERYNVSVSYEASRDRLMPPTTFILDWGIYKSRQWVEVHGRHQLAEAVSEINQSIKRWNESGGGLSVFVRDGDKKDERQRETRAA